MQKLPVGRSIAHAYEFLFGRFFQIVGTAWLPALIYACVYYLWLQNAVTWMGPISPDPNLRLHGIVMLLAMLAVALVVRAVLGISLTQEALGIRKDLTLAHFVVGPREIRLIFAQIRLFLIVLVLYAVTAAVIVLGIGAAVKYGSAIPPSPLVGGKSLVVVGAIVAAVLLYIAFALTILKMSFLLSAVASVEKHAKVRRAWQLAGGSGWRIVLVLLGTFLPIALVVVGGVYLAFGADLSAAMHAAAGNARVHALLQFYADHALVLAIIAGIVAAVGGALMAGATAAAYRTVTGHEEEETADDDALVAPLLAPVPVPVRTDDHAPADHGHGGHDDHGHSGGHDDHGHGGGHDDHGHGGGHGHGGHDEAHGHGDSHDDDDDADDDHGHGHEDSHGSHGDGHGHGGHDDHGHHDDKHGHDDHGHSHDDHGHGGHGDGHHHHAKAA